MCPDQWIYQRRPVISLTYLESIGDVDISADSACYASSRSAPSTAVKNQDDLLPSIMSPAPLVLPLLHKLLRLPKFGVHS